MAEISKGDGGHFELEKESLNIIDFCDKYCGDEKCPEIVRAVRNATGPVKLDLKGNRIEAAGAKILSEMLKASSKVVSLSLEWNNVGFLDQGIEAIARALEVNTHLTELDLRNNNIGPDGAKELAQALRRNQTLKCLDLRWNDIGMSGTSALIEMLNVNKTLLKLEVMGNNTSLDQIEQMERLLNRNAGTESDTKKKVLVSNQYAHLTEDQLLLQVMSEKESIEEEVKELKRQLLKSNERTEEEQNQVAMLRKEIHSLMEDRSRLQQRELDLKTDLHEVKLKFDELENHRKMEFEEYRNSKLSLERENLSIREKMTQLEANHSKTMDQKQKFISRLEDEKYTIESDLHRLKSLNRSQEEDIEKFLKLQSDLVKEMERKEAKLVGDLESSRTILMRQHENAISALESQLRLAVTQQEDAQRQANLHREKSEVLQANLLQLKVSHEKELSESKARWEKETEERLQRSVGVVEAQMEELKKTRQQMEEEMTHHLETISSFQQAKSNQREEFQNQTRKYQEEINEFKKKIHLQEDMASQLSKEKESIETRYQQLLKQLGEKEKEMERQRIKHEERMKHFTDVMQKQIDELEKTVHEKCDMITSLENRHIFLQRQLSNQEHEYDKRMDQFTGQLTNFIHEQLMKERGKRKNRTESHGEGAVNPAE